MKIKSLIKNSLFAKSFNLAKSNPGKIGLMVLFDALFVVSLLSLKALLSYLDAVLGAPISWEVFFIKLVFFFAYYLIVLFIYSFFEYIILDFVKSLFEKTEFSFKRLFNFYQLNIIFTGIFLVLAFIFSYLIASIKPQYQPYVFIIVSTPFILFLYLVLKIAHIRFYENEPLSKIIKNSFNAAFTNLPVLVIAAFLTAVLLFPVLIYRQLLDNLFIPIFFVFLLSLFMYLKESLWSKFANLKMGRETILIVPLLISFLFIILYVIGYLLRLFLSDNYLLYLTYYSYFTYATIVLSSLLIFVIILINRISFYSIARTK